MRLRNLLTPLTFILLAGWFVAACSDDTAHSNWTIDSDIDAVSEQEEAAYERQCEEGDFIYEDELCGRSGDCTEVGDGKCYARCESDSDCTEPQRPHCTLRGLFDGGDWNCNDSVMICTAEESDRCPR